MKIQIWDSEEKVMLSHYDIAFELLSGQLSSQEFFEVVLEGNCDRYKPRLFTGLKDIKGREIYQGDLIQKPDGRICEVIWFSSPSYNGWDLKAKNSLGKPSEHIMLWIDKWEVIGHTYEN
jgi:hypothetical protein